MPSQAPKCPWCAKPMTYVQAMPAAGGGARKRRYECKRCIVVYTELDRDGDDTPDRARNLDREPVHTLQ